MTIEAKKKQGGQPTGNLVLRSLDMSTPLTHHQPLTKRTARRATASLAIIAAACFALAIWATSSYAAPTTVKPLSASNYTTKRACQRALAGEAECFAEVLEPATAAARAHTTPLGITRRAFATPGGGLAAEGDFGLRPSDLHGAYDLPTATEASSLQTIAVVDAYDDPTAEADLATYDEEFDLPACTTANHCFAKVNQNGQTSPLPEPEDDWAVEISLDIEMAHATCQNCHIILVEAEAPILQDLEAAERTAVELGATEVSNSYGGPDEYEHGGYDYPGVVITASTGDWGHLEPASYPASSPNVIAVGGTTLDVQEGKWINESAWLGTGGGCNPLAEAPSWQLALSNWGDVSCPGDRVTADVSADADPYTGVAIYDSSLWGEAGWITVGGTSVASPLIASTFALAGGSRGMAYPAETLYSHLGSIGLHDITAGANGPCGFLCEAVPGWNSPTGVGTPDGLSAFQPTSHAHRPLINTIEPEDGPSVGGTTVTIHGANLADATGVTFGDTPATITGDSATTITAVAPAHPAGTVDLSVTTQPEGRTFAANGGSFTYLPPAPTIIEASPHEGPAAGDTIVTIHGSALEGAYEVSFGGSSAPIISRSAEEVTVISPPHEPGTIALSVTTASGTGTSTASNDYTYTDTSSTHAKGGAAGGDPGPGDPPPHHRSSLIIDRVSLHPKLLHRGQQAKLALSLSEPASVLVTIQKAPIDGRCHREHLRSARCSSADTITTVSYRTRRGVNSLALPTSKLTPGRYTVTISAKAGRQQGYKLEAASFTVAGAR